LSTLRRARLRASALLITLLTVLFPVVGVVGAAAPAEAATYQSRVVNEAAHHRGQPYRYGANGPTHFDCSGFTQYVFGRFGKRLPHNSAQQYNVVHHVAKNRLAVGDLMFFRSSSGRIGHVAIYAGNGRMWHAPKSGDVVRLAGVYSSNYVVGRI
jgi:cell wall-associated NlpC family hydrolase